MIAKCIDNSYHPVSLLLGKEYTIIDREDGMIRIIDEDNETYMYPEDFFIIINEQNKEHQ